MVIAGAVALFREILRMGPSKLLVGRIPLNNEVFYLVTVLGKLSSLLIAQTKAISSLAIAVVTTCVGFPFARNLLNLLHNLSWAFQAISCIA